MAIILPPGRIMRRKTQPGPSLRAPLPAPGRPRLKSGRADVVKQTQNGRNVPGIQKFLRSKGYNIPLDGVFGPKTKSAMDDWHRGTQLRNPGQWNVRARSTVDPPARTTRPGTAPAGPVGPVGGSPRTSPRRSTSGGGGGGYSPGSSGIGGFVAGALGQDPNVGSPIPDTWANQGAQPINPRDWATAGAQPIDPKDWSTRGAQTIDPKDYANQGAQLYDRNRADAMAGQEFDPQIFTEQNALNRLKPQGAQNEADINNWYGQVLASQAKAAGRDTEASAAGKQGVSDATAAILASLGGAGNAAASSVAGAGQEALGALAAGGAAQDQFNADTAPIYKLAQAGALGSERASQRTAESDLVNQLASLKGQRGQAVSNDQLQLDQANNAILDNRAGRGLDIAQMNNGILDNRAARALGIVQGNNDIYNARADRGLGIAEANNTIRDSRLANRLGIRQANNAMAQGAFGNSMSQAELGVSSALTGAQIYSYTHPKAAAAGSRYAKGAFSNSSPSVKQQAFQTAIGSVTDSAQQLPNGDPNPNYGQPAKSFRDPDGSVNVPKLVAAINQVIAGYGWSRKNPAVLAFRNNILNNWGIRADPRWR